ncbi:major facilitator superfamily domain-containing protein [Phlyctochytrium arcticum]|nr:major facilitator superfamily domain-containing protein [Phlyctochytrium arcticum]
MIQQPPPIQWRPFLISLVRPLWVDRDFRLVFMSRFVFQLGIATIQQFMQYWIKDSVETAMPATRAVSLALLPLLGISPISALLIPSRRRKITVYVAALLMSCTAIILATAHTFPLALLASSIMGVGYGPFISVEFAMLIDVLPSGKDAAKDMSLWHSALVLPQIVATPIAGWIRDLGQEWGETWGVVGLGYKIIFSLCVVYFISGALVTRAISKVT